MRGKAAAGQAIFLTGFMGSGKTTVGRLLAHLAGYDFLDLDDLIVMRAGKSIDDIFVESGEDEFRRLERAAVASLRSLARTVVALGGGTYTFASNREQIRLIGKTVWLDCPFDLCLSRIEDDGSRPLLRKKESLRSLFDERRNSYRLADYAFNIGGESPDEVAHSIAIMLKSKGRLE
ncbi:MAG TPA: shikimate kinase [Blastocatellia bacterium]|nr:shikimate kinase [Blastocatellia bacterium]